MKTLFCFVLTVASAVVPVRGTFAEGRTPNILLIYADDLGPGMLGCYGQKELSTPHIDQLAREGMRFTQFYGCNVCAPARASLLSGLHTGHAMEPTKGGLEASLHIGALTEEAFLEQIRAKRPERAGDADYLGEVARRAGYHTSYFGKLGVGFTDTHEMMRDYGFDQYCGLLDSVTCWSFYPEYYWEQERKTQMPGNPKQTTRNPNLFPVGEEAMTYSEDVWLEKALAYLDTDRDEPFFMVYATQLPHGPVSIAPEDLRYQNRKGWSENERLYASMMSKLDASVGALLAKLDALGIAENTMVLLTSDNGHEPSYYRSTSKQEDQKFSHRTWDGHTHGEDRFAGTMGLRGTKRYNFEGGLRVPMLVRWPGTIAAGSTCEHRAVVYDLLPTLAEIGGVAVSHPLDGISFLPSLLSRGDAQNKHEFLFWAGSNAYTRDAIIVGDWKLIEEKDLDRSSKGKSVYGWALYDLQQDPFERRNLATRYPERVQQMRQLVEKAKRPLSSRGPMRKAGRI